MLNKTLAVVLLHRLQGYPGDGRRGVCVCGFTCPTESFKLNKYTPPFTNGKLLVGAKNGKEKSG